MNWNAESYYDRNSDPDFLADDRHARQHRRPPAAPSSKDIAQDAAIHRLEKENHELKVYVAALARLLVSKGSVSAQEIAEVVSLADRVQHEAPVYLPDHRKPLRSMILPDHSA